ncbi:hypothetical protein HG530_009665 [Fusarium avenaceum]|nr:hypothetical protein HG530_009665 [Fusarium avenaceum]
MTPLGPVLFLLKKLHNHLATLPDSNDIDIGTFVRLENLVENCLDVRKRSFTSRNFIQFLDVSPSSMHHAGKRDISSRFNGKGPILFRPPVSLTYVGEDNARRLWIISGSSLLGKRLHDTDHTALGNTTRPIHNSASEES